MTPELAELDKALQGLSESFAKWCNRPGFTLDMAREKADELGGLLGKVIAEMLMESVASPPTRLSVVPYDDA